MTACVLPNKKLKMIKLPMPSKESVIGCRRKGEEEESERLCGKDYNVKWLFECPFGYDWANRDAPKNHFNSKRCIKKAQAYKGGRKGLLADAHYKGDDRHRSLSLNYIKQHNYTKEDKVYLNPPSYPYKTREWTDNAGSRTVSEEERLAMKNITP